MSKQTQTSARKQRADERARASVLVQYERIKRAYIHAQVSAAQLMALTQWKNDQMRALAHMSNGLSASEAWDKMHVEDKQLGL